MCSCQDSEESRTNESDKTSKVTFQLTSWNGECDDKRQLECSSHLLILRCLNLQQKHYTAGVVGGDYCVHLQLCRVFQGCGRRFKDGNCSERWADRMAGKKQRKNTSRFWICQALQWTSPCSPRNNRVTNSNPARLIAPAYFTERTKAQRCHSPKLIDVWAAVRTVFLRLVPLSSRCSLFVLQYKS